MVDLRALYVADMNNRFVGQIRSEVGWLTLVGDPAPGAESVAYHARCAERATAGG